MPADYRPNGMAMWDTWYIEHQGSAHAYYLQRLSPGSTRSPADADWLGHAISDNLLQWRECPLALGPGEAGTLDELQPWTGCVIEHDGTFYLYYTMRSTRGNGFGQHIGLATSHDLYHWERFSGNPVISPDPRWYISHDSPLPRNVLDCRDLIVIRHPEKDGWLGFYAARVPAEEEAETAVIATVWTKDLVHWEHLPPAFAPRKYACIEVPDVFSLDGRWYMTCLTGTAYGNRGIFSDPSVLRGTMYAVADKREGPYDEFNDDNVLVGGTHYVGYSCRSLVFEGDRYGFYTQPTTDGHDTLSPPMHMIADSQGHLRFAYSPKTSEWREATLVTPVQPPQVSQLPHTQRIWPLPAGRWTLDNAIYHGQSRTGWQVADLGIGARNVEIEVSTTIHTGVAAGVVYRPDVSQTSSEGDLVFLLDADEQCVLATRLPDYVEQHRRRYTVQLGQAYHLRICVRPPRFEVYLDDVLVIQSATKFPENTTASVGLFVDRAVVELSNLSIYGLYDHQTVETSAASTVG